MPDSTPLPPDALTAVGQPEPTSMADLIALIDSDGDLSDVRRRNVASSIRRFCTALGYEPSEAPVSFAFYRDRLQRFHPLAAGIKKKRWQTIRSDVSFALKRAGVAGSAPRRRTPEPPEWAALKTGLSSNAFKWTLPRLARFCAEQGLRPQDVDDAVMDAYARTLRETSFKTRPARHHRGLCRLWNEVVALHPVLGLREVTLPCYRETYSASWDAFPASFRREADCWLESLSKEADLLSVDGPIKPLRPASVDAYRYALRQLAAGLVAKGWALDRIDSLAVLVEPKAAEAALRFFLDRNKGESNSSLQRLAHVLVLIAETAVHPSPEDLALLKRFRAQLRVRCYGMRPKPKNTLRPFTDPANIERILMLPQRIHDRMRRKRALTLADARLMQVALALELLLMRPIRRTNMVSLRLDEHVIRSGRQTFIVIPSEEVKNDLALDYPVPPESAAMLDFYVKRALPLFGPNPVRRLFPGQRADGSKSPEQFSAFFVKTIREETGLYLYPHLTRHFGAALYLRENPGAFEVVRRVLGHKSLTTTTRSYASFDDEAAVRMFDALVVRIRETIRKEVGRD